MSGGGVASSYNVANPQFKPEQNSLTPMALFNSYQQMFGRPQPWQQQQPMQQQTPAQPSPMPAAYSAPQPPQAAQPPQASPMAPLSQIVPNSPGFGTKTAAGGK